MTFKVQTLISMALVLMGFVAQPREALSSVQDPQPQDSIEQLRLMPEQRQQIRRIIEQTKDERQMVNRRLREANFALDQALDVLDENLIEQKMAELTAAQAAQTRFRVQTEVRIRRVLTPEQLVTLRNLHLQIRDVMGNQRPNQRGLPADSLRPNQRNTIAPTIPRRNDPLRTPRP
jgi:Spy/CpxP family protein refolding chaperone